MNVLKSRRLGRFRMSIELLNEMPEAAKVVTSRLTAVVRTSMRLEMSDIEYVAICDDFPEIPDGNLLPLYSPTLNKVGGGPLEFSGWTREGRPLNR